MSYLHAAVLGLVQALGEFLPISSSAHLVLVPWLLGWEYQGKAYDVALHWGTMVAVCAFFWKDWIRLITAGFTRRDETDFRLFWGIALATIPGGLAGLALEHHVERYFHSPTTIAGVLAAFALLLWLSDHLSRKDQRLDALSWRGCLLIGCAQALAIVPGVSRSGITMTAALWLGLRREDAARFSFLLSVPIVVAAGALEFRHTGAEAMTAPFWLGIFVTAGAGLAAIRFLLAYLRNRSTALFAIYRVALALFCVLWAMR